jgi:hypothetical protein
MRLPTPFVALGVLAGLSAGMTGCAPAAPPAMAATAHTEATPPPAPAAPAIPTEPSLAVLVRPAAGPGAVVVHVEVDVVAPSAALARWKLSAGSPDHLARPAARDSSGPLPVELEAQSEGVAFELGRDRAPAGLVHLEYDVVAARDAPDDPLAVVVADGHFRAAGERLVALPEAIEDQVLPISIAIDGSQVHAPEVASSLGLGASRQRKARARALRYAIFLGGALGEATFDAPEGHDEAAWLGAPAFDVRGVFTELAEVRTFLAEILEARDLLPGPPETYLIDASQPRAEGAFVVTPRFESVLLQIGSGEPWGVPERLALVQLLARRWIGDAIRFKTPPGGHASELDWFNDGVSRYQAMRLVALGKFLSPDQWAEAIAGELSTLATSPYAHAGNQELAAASEKDPRARTAIMVRGALYAARESAAINTRTKGNYSIEHALVDLLRQSRAGQGQGGAGQQAGLPASAWVDTVAKDDPDAAKTFDALIVHGGPVSLPNGALGPCFRAGTGDYVAFDPGFDVAGSRASKDGKVVGVRADGPAARAGLRDGDILESIQMREGDAAVPVDLTLRRAGEKVTLTYAPKGAHARAQTWTRVRGVPDERCGPPP